jgi:hypothetical protein
VPNGEDTDLIMKHPTHAHKKGGFSQAINKMVAVISTLDLDF